MEPDNMLSTSTLEDDDKNVYQPTSTATADDGDTKDTNKHNDDDDKEHDNDNDKTGSKANNKDNSTKDITSSSSSSSSVAMKRMSSTASLSESSSSKRVKQEDTTDGPNTEEKARSPSALIEIVNDFARDHFDDQGNTYPLLYNGTGPISPILNENEYLRGYYDEQFVDESKTSDTEAKTDWEEEGRDREQPLQVPSVASSSENIDPSMPTTEYSLSSIQSRRKSYQQIEHERKEKRWERFLHILFSTDYALQPTRKRQTVTSKKGSSTETKQSTSSVKTDTKNFHPIHAWVRCLCSPYIGLEQAHSYGVWSVLHEMRQRIPEEFSVRDENDGNRSVFQILAENKAADCKLSNEEKRDIVECIMEANYKAVHLPRQSDGRLIGHVALENGWPGCKDVLLKKMSATCA